MIDLVIVGGGPAGLAAAYSAWQHGLRDILILERDNELGGILNQCIHNGFGLHRTGQDTGGVGQFFLAIGGTVGAGIAGYIIIVFRVHLQVAATGAADTNDLTLFAHEYR